MANANIFAFTDTWNDAGTTFSAIKVNVTDTASQADSTLIDLEVGGASQASVTKAGEVICKGLTSSQNIDLQGNRLVMDADNDTYLEATTDDRLDVVVGGTLVARFDANATDTFQLDGVGFSPTGAVVGQALGFPNSATTVEPYTPAGAGDLLAAANETVTGDWNFTGALQWNGVQVVNLSAAQTLTNKSLTSPTLTGAPDLSGLTDAGKRGVLEDLSVKEIFYAENYGVEVTVASDQSSGIQAAIDAAEAAGGGIVQLPAGEIRIDTGLTIEASNVLLRGVGGDMNHDAGTDQYATRLSAYAAIDMVTVRTIQNVSSAINWGSGVSDLDLAGRSTATRCLKYNSLRHAICRNVAARSATVCTLDIDNYAQGDLAEQPDVQRCEFRRISLRQIDGATARAADCMRVGDSDQLANVSYNFFDEIDIQHWDGKGIHIRNGDNNVFRLTRVFQPGGTGDSLTIDGNNGSPLVKTNEANRFEVAYFQGAVNLLSTSSGFLAGTTKNYFLLDTSNGSSEPVLESGATAIIDFDKGETKNASFNQLVIGDGATSIANAKSNLSSASVILGNGSDNNVILCNSAATQRWGINVENSTGNFRISRQAGSGIISFNVDTVATAFFANNSVATTDPAGIDTGFGTNKVVWAQANGATGLGEVKAIGDDYNTGFESVTLGQYGTSATGTTLGVSNADLARVWALNASALVIGTNGGSPVVFGTAGVESFRVDPSTQNVNIASGNVLEVAGTQVVGARVVDANLADTAALTAQTLTDNSGGTASDTIAAIGATYSQSEVANAVASLADEINKLRADNVAQKTAIDAALSLIRTHGLGATS